MSGLANLSQCMMDSDPEVLARARRLRREAILVSVVLEAVLLAAMLVWPLLTLGVLPHRYILTPLPPYRGGGGSASVQHQRKGIHPPAISDRLGRIKFPTPKAASHAHELATESAPDIQPGSGNPFGIDFGPASGPAGPFVPWGNSHGPSVERPHAPPAKPAIRQRISEGVMAGSLIYRVEPAYPQIAIAMRLTGTVRLRAIIATDGTVQNLEILSGNPILAPPARDAVSRWRYRPTLLNGDPVEVETYITVSFVLAP